MKFQTLNNKRHVFQILVKPFVGVGDRYHYLLFLQGQDKKPYSKEYSQGKYIWRTDSFFALFEDVRAREIFVLNVTTFSLCNFRDDGVSLFTFETKQRMCDFKIRIWYKDSSTASVVKASESHLTPQLDGFGNFKRT